MKEGSTLLLVRVVCVIMYVYTMAAIMSCFPRLEWIGSKKMKSHLSSVHSGHSSDDSTPGMSA